MILEFAKDNTGTLIHISEIGKEKVFCPFCDNVLKPKRGQKRIHHFAHLEGESCRGSEVMNAIDYHMYKKLSPAQQGVITAIAESGAIEFESREVSHGMYQSFYDLRYYVKSGRAGYCNLSIAKRTIKSINEKGFFDEFAEFSYSGFKIVANDLSKIYSLQCRLKDAFKFFESQFLLIDNEVIRKTFDRLNASILYFINIKTNESEFQKIGVTNDFDRRKGEIERFLKKHFLTVEVTIIKNTQLAILEHYFKRYYSGNQFKVKKTNVTEYFQFSKEGVESVKKELKIAELSGRKHRKKIMEGLKNRSNNGRSSESIDKFLNKPKSQKIANSLNEGLGVREIARSLNCSVNTVRKVKKHI